MLVKSIYLIINKYKLYNFHINIIYINGYCNQASQWWKHWKNELNIRKTCI